MNPGFTALFERSCYSRHNLAPDEESKKRLREQRERFAGAMLGFGLEFDSELRAHFLQTVCGLDKAVSQSKWKILIEPTRGWGDLVLENVANSLLLVVEMKMGSGLNAHQDPSSKSFDEGYARGIRNYGKLHGFEDLHYITLEKEASWSKPNNAKLAIRCTSAEWRQLVLSTAGCQVIEWIYDCLGSFGISVLAARKMINMKLGSNATNVLSLLATVFESQGPEFKPAKYLDAGTGYIGVKLPASRFSELSALVEPESDWVAWFGYESEPARLSFWFYCEKKNGVKPRSVGRIEKLLVNSGFLRERISVEKETNNLGLFCLAEESTGDFEWFQKVFEVIKRSSQ